MRRRYAGITFGLLALIAAFSCRRAEPPPRFFPAPASGEFTVMSYNVRMFRYSDRDNDGQEDDFKPESEVIPLLGLIHDAAPDIVVMQELGDLAALETLRQRLKELGSDYPHYDHLIGSSDFANLGILSKFPIIARDPLTNLVYSIQSNTLPVLRGFQQVDIDVRGHPIRVINAHLKSKLFHELGQTEMRRNEARLLASHLRRLAREQPDQPLVVCGDFNDGYNSSALRELLAQENLRIEDLRLSDRFGDMWTHYFRRDQVHSRIDYIMVNPVMKARWVEAKSGVIRDARTYEASDHRPIVATFKESD